jgi:amidase
LVGKTNCPEFAFGVDTVNSLHGATRNPLGDFTAGGSSGGEAAAVAAGMSALGVGTDFGGSIRWPAECTGLVGLRPTVGRLSRAGVLPTLDDDEPLVPNPRSVQGRLEVPGLLARCVDDIEAALRVVAGPDPFDMFTVPVALGDSSDGTLGGVELRWAGGLAGVSVTSEVAAAVAAAADILAQAGVTVTEGVPSAIDEAPELYAALRSTDPLDEIRRYAEGHADLLEPVVSRLLARPPDSREPDVVRLWARRDRLGADLAGWLRGNRLLALPVSTCPPLPIGVSSGADDLVGRFDALTPCRAVSLFGLPAASVPCGVTPDGRPLSVQLVAPAFREDLVLAAGRVIERWSGTRS